MRILHTIVKLILERPKITKPGTALKNNCFQFYNTNNTLLPTINISTSEACLCNILETNNSEHSETIGAISYHSNIA